MSYSVSMRVKVSMELPRMPKGFKFDCFQVVPGAFDEVTLETFEALEDIEAAIEAYNDAQPSLQALAIDGDENLKASYWTGVKWTPWEDA